MSSCEKSALYYYYYDDDDNSRQQERLVAMMLHGQRAWLGGHSMRSTNTLVSRIMHGVSGSATDPRGLCRVF